MPQLHLTDAWAPLKAELDALGISFPAKIYEIDPRTAMSRPALAKTMTELGVLPIAAATLARRATSGDGPPYRRWSASRSVYAWGDAILWAARQLSPQLRSTSESPRCAAKPAENRNGA